MSDKHTFNDEDLLKVSGGLHITSTAVSNFVAILTKRPGIVDRARAMLLDDEDEKVILEYFTIEYFLAFAKHAAGKSIEELLKEACD